MPPEMARTTSVSSWRMGPLFPFVLQQNVPSVAALLAAVGGEARVVPEQVAGAPAIDTDDRLGHVVAVVVHARTWTNNPVASTATVPSASRRRPCTFWVRRGSGRSRQASTR